MFKEGFEKIASARWSKEFWKAKGIPHKAPYAGRIAQGVPPATTFKNIEQKFSYLNKSDPLEDRAKRMEYFKKRTAPYDFNYDAHKSAITGKPEKKKKKK